MLIINASRRLSNANGFARKEEAYSRAREIYSEVVDKEEMQGISFPRIEQSPQQKNADKEWLKYLREKRR